MMQTMLDRIDEVQMVIPPDSAWKYSNMAYGFLGEVVSRLSGQSFERFAQSEIFDPLDMMRRRLRKVRSRRPIVLPAIANRRPG